MLLGEGEESEQSAIAIAIAMTVFHSPFTNIFIPVVSVINITFAIVHWYVVSFVSVSAYHPSSKLYANNDHNGYLLEEGPDDPYIVIKCVDIQGAISLASRLSLAPMIHEQHVCLCLSPQLSQPLHLSSEY